MSVNTASGPKPLSSAWTQHLSDPQAKEDFAVIVRNSTLLLTRLKGIIEEHERTLSQASFSVNDFSDPNWSHKAAHRFGALAELKKLKDLIPF